MKRHILRTFLVLTAILLLACGLAAGASAETENGWQYQKVDPRFDPVNDETVWKAMITGYTGSETDLVFPTRLGGLVVYGVDEKAFQGNSRITSVSIPYYYRGLGAYAFEGCSNLKEIHFTSPYSWGLGVGVFDNCSALEKVTSYGSMSGGRDASVKPAVWRSAFRNAGSASGGFVLTYRGTGYMEIYERAFEGSCVKEVTFEKGGIGIIRSEAFKDCKVLETISLGERCIYVEKDAFKGCSNLKTVNYYGSSSKWKKVNIESGNQALKNAKVYYRLQTPVVYVENKSSGIQLQWEAIPNAKEYKIYRKAGDGKYKLAKTAKSSATSYLDKVVKDKSGTKYTYKVVAVNGKRKSDFITKQIMRMGRPTVKLQQTDEGIKITWTKVKGADGYIVRGERVEGNDVTSLTVKVPKGIRNTYTCTVVPYFDYSDENGAGQYHSLGAERKKNITVFNKTGIPERVDGWYFNTAGILQTAADNRPAFNPTLGLSKNYDIFNAYRKEAGYPENLEQSDFYRDFSPTSMVYAIQHDDGRYGVEIRGWGRSSTTKINMVLEYLCFICEDEEVAFALWQWIDACNTGKGSNNSDDYGFKDVRWKNGSGVIAMNGIEVEVVEVYKLGEYYGTEYYFSR